MNAQIAEWKLKAEQIWSAPEFEPRAAAFLVAEVARESEDTTLRQRAAQALPSLREACERTRDRRGRDVAQRRFGAMRDCLHALAGPRFGRRRSVPEALTEDERHRRTLSLPTGHRLFGPQINQAYKRAAKAAHPDAGGDRQRFEDICTARDALMKSL